MNNLFTHKKAGVPLRKFFLGTALALGLAQPEQGYAYCTPTPAPTGSSYYINSFTTTGGLTNITNNNSGFSTGGYGNFTTMSCSAIQGTSLSFASSFLSGTFGARLWIDWNHDDDFDDPGETIFQTTSYVSSITGNINVPLTAVAGPTRMRIRIHWLSSTGPVACNETNNSAYVGETEDYTFNVVPLAPPDNAGVGSLITPDATPFCSNSYQDVSVSVVNKGSNALNTATISWTVNGVAQPPVSLPVSLPNYQDSVTVVLGSVLFPTTAPVDIRAWTEMPNGMIDSDFSDDTLVTSATASLQGVDVQLSPRDTTICQNQSISFDAGDFPNNPIYIWSTGSLDQTVTVSTAGAYSVKVQNNLGCFDRDTVYVSVYPNPVANSIAIIDNGGGSFTFNVIGAQNITGYEWDFHDGTALVTGSGTPGQQLHTFNAPGEYNVTLTLRNDCGEIVITRLVKIDATTGIDALSALQKELKIFPNPGKELITIAPYGKLKITRVAIYSIMGQKIYAAEANGGAHQVNVAAFASGLYNVIIETDKGNVTKKLEVTR